MSIGTVPGALSSSGPAMAYSNGLLYFAWKGNSSNEVWYAAADTKSGTVVGTVAALKLKDLSTFTWPVNQQKINGASTAYSPALASDLDSMAIAWTDLQTGSVKVATFSDNAWTQHAEIPGSDTNMSPAIAYFCGNIHVLWRDSRNGVVYGTCQAGPTSLEWAPVEIFAEVSTTFAPALTSIDAMNGRTIYTEAVGQNAPYPTYAVMPAWAGSNVKVNTEFGDFETNLSYASYLYTFEYWTASVPEGTVVNSLVAATPVTENYSLSSAIWINVPSAPAVSFGNNMGVIMAWSQGGSILFGGDPTPSGGQLTSTVYPHTFVVQAHLTDHTPALAWSLGLQPDGDIALLCAWTQPDGRIVFDYGPVFLDVSSGFIPPPEARVVLGSGWGGDYPSGWRKLEIPQLPQQP